MGPGSGVFPWPPEDSRTLPDLACASSGTERVCFCSLRPHTWPSVGFRPRVGKISHYLRIWTTWRLPPAAVAGALHWPLNQIRSGAGAGDAGGSVGGGAQQLGSVSLVGTRPLLAKEARARAEAALGAHPGPWKAPSALGSGPGRGLGAGMPGTESWLDF